MIIVRDGKTFELTDRELADAYYEQEHLFDIEDVKGELESIVSADVDEEEYVAAAQRILDSPELLNDCARDKRRNTDKYGMAWDAATTEAVKDAVCAEMK